MTVIISPKVYTCPNCTTRAELAPKASGAHMHTCPGLHGITAPLVLEGISASVETVERGDYINGEHGVTFDDEGRAVTAVVTRHADGSNDCAVFAPTATATSNL